MKINGKKNSRHNDETLNQQHGFVNNKSCATNLLETLDFLTETLNRGFLALLIFQDFAKAFDKVSLKVLLVKLKAYGFTDEIITWIKDYLTNRKQRVAEICNCPKISTITIIIIITFNIFGNYDYDYNYYQKITITIIITIT